MYDRHLFIDFLQPIEMSKVGIFVKSNDLVEGFDIEVFFRPFENWTWMVVTLSSLLISICIITLWKIFNKTSDSFLFGIKVLAMSMQANLGTDSFSTLKSQFSSIKIIFLTSLMMGNGLWLAYNGALLSELITPTVKKPFYDLESLSKTNYR